MKLLRIKFSPFNQMEKYKEYETVLNFNTKLKFDYKQFQKLFSN